MPERLRATRRASADAARSYDLPILQSLRLLGGAEEVRLTPEQTYGPGWEQQARISTLSDGFESALYDSLQSGPILMAERQSRAISEDDDREFYLSAAFLDCEWCGAPQVMFQSVLCVRCERFRPWELISHRAAGL